MILVRHVEIRPGRLTLPSDRIEMLTQSAEGTMCNDYRLMVDVASIIEEFEHLKIKIRFPEGRPNIEAREDIRITDTAPIVRTAAGERGVGELVQRRWCWPSPTKKPVYNFRSEDREFNSNRVLVIADAFFEFTTPEDPKKKRKNKWMFRKAGEPIFAIAASGVRRRRLAKPSPC